MNQWDVDSLLLISFSTFLFTTLLRCWLMFFLVILGGFRRRAWRRSRTSRTTGKANRKSSFWTASARSCATMRRRGSWRQRQNRKTIPTTPPALVIGRPWMHDSSRSRGQSAQSIRGPSQPSALSPSASLTASWSLAPEAEEEEDSSILLLLNC